MIIISAGSPGADRGALQAAIELDVGAGGWFSPEGDTPDIFASRLRPTTSIGLARRLNVQDSDATLIITVGAEMAGPAAFAAKHAQQQRRQCKHLALPLGVETRLSDATERALIDWLSPFNILHVCGDGTAEAEQATYAVMLSLLRQMQAERTSAACEQLVAGTAADMAVPSTIGQPDEHDGGCPVTDAIRYGAYGGPNVAACDCGATR